MNRLTAWILCSISLACTAAEPDISDLTIDQRAERIQRLMTNWEADGASGAVLVAQHGTVVFNAGFGSASCRDEEPISPSHHFMIGSITKEFTQVLGHILQSKGILSLSDRVSDHITGMPDQIGRITIRQLIDHTAGLPDLIDENGRPIPYSVEYDYIPTSREDLLNKLRLARLEFEPDSDEVYSNLGYQLLAVIYELAAGSSYEQLLQQYIFEPAAMTDPGFWFEDNAQREFADGCRFANEHWGNPIDDDMWDEAGASWNLKGAGGLLSTTASLARFFTALGNHQLFDAESDSVAYKNSRMVFSNRRGQLVMGPAGSNGIFNAVAFWMDGDELVLIMITNRAEHPAEGGMFSELLGLFPASPPA